MTSLPTPTLSRKGGGRSSPRRLLPHSTVDAADVARFDKLAADWWNPWGPMRPLHKMNPLRADYVSDLMVEAFGLGAKASAEIPPLQGEGGERSEPGGVERLGPPPQPSPLQGEGAIRDRLQGKNARPLAGQKILDIGCGGGLLSEALAGKGAEVTGIDPAGNNIDVARAHAQKSGLAIDYRATTVEALPADTALFDAVLALEVVEHVADRKLFLRTATRLLRPGGLMILSTLNRTAKSFAIAIVGAEYLLRWLPRGTHDWNQFVTPDELTADLRAEDLVIFDRTGVVYNPIFGEWRTSTNCDVNYFLAAEKPA